MNKTLRISFTLKNTYRVNSILYSLKQVPLLGKLLPQKLYQSHGLKVFANVLSVLWELITVFAGKLIYIAVMIAGIPALYAPDDLDQGRMFLHIFVCLTLIGGFINTYLFNPSRDKYYAIILMRMNAREYTLINYGYALIKTVIGFMISAFIFGLESGLRIWQCILIPFYVVGVKVLMAVLSLYRYEKTGVAVSENTLDKVMRVVTVLLLAAAYGLPALGWLLPEGVSLLIMTVSVIGGIVAGRKLISFPDYNDMCRQMLITGMNQVEEMTRSVKQQEKRYISVDQQVGSSRKGFEYLNELFIKRHQKLLWKSSKKIAMVSLGIILVLLLCLFLKPKLRADINGALLIYLPYFVFIMYVINRGETVTRVMFMNCDHSLLTYAFYKQPRAILRLFQIRLRELVKINLLPAAVIGTGMAVLLYASGGTDNKWNYLVLVISVLSMSIFFSVHYLTIYYLLQPYNIGTEMKSSSYQIITSVTYFICFGMIYIKMPIMIFGVAMIAFCILYCIIASVLIYRFASVTFRLRM